MKKKGPSYDGVKMVDKKIVGENQQSLLKMA